MRIHITIGLQTYTSSHCFAIIANCRFWPGAGCSSMQFVLSNFYEYHHMSLPNIICRLDFCRRHVTQSHS